MVGMMESFSKRLDKLTAKVEGVSEVDKTSTEVFAIRTLRHLGRSSFEQDHPLNDYSPILQWPKLDNRVIKQRVEGHERPGWRSSEAADANAGRGGTSFYKDRRAP